MKINYKNTALGLIDDPKNFHFGFPDPDITPELNRGQLLAFGYSIINAADSLRELCGHNIQFVSRPFWEAYAKSRHKLINIFNKEEIDEGGVLILPGDGITHTYYYYIKTYFTENNDWGYDCLFMDFNKRNTEAHIDGPALDVYTSCTLSEDGMHLDRKNLIWSGYTKSGKDEKWFEAMILTFVLFKKYCEIETKTIEPKRKGNVAGKKYINETDKRIIVLDSTWFTTLVKSGSFMVGDDTGGFFRLQPYGPGNSKRKLIWVMPFEKSGYTRMAKVLNQNIDNGTKNN